MGGLAVCVQLLPLTGRVAEEDLCRTAACLFDGITIDPDERPGVRRAREQIAAGERLARLMGMDRNDAVDICHFLHPDGSGSWDALMRYEQIVVDAVLFCKGRGFNLAEVA